MQADKRITILGLGNVLLGDEGFGVHFVEWFRPRWRLPAKVSVLDGGVLGYRLLDTVTDCEHLIAIDVLKVADAPGSVYRFTFAELQARLPDPTSAHEVEFPHVLMMAELMDQAPETVFLCVVPELLGESTAMQPLMATRFALVEELLLKELARLGVRPPRADA
ncbi:MAG: Hydrogenase 2 maturation protease [Deltaproteobacteria bacterium ADurb.Bin510]|nr:MAG: Hydrogenase 2 maturation protease [Deltaproteobacteria bacterium ADurb.Bin510]